jgi:hypothetical protein
MKVTGFCNICGREQEDIAHALFKCPHSYSLWMAMRKVWHLPQDVELQINSLTWFQSSIMSIPATMIENVLLIAWRAWYCRNEVTHAKPLSTVEGSKRFLVGYLNTLGNLKSMSTDQLLKGKYTLSSGSPNVAERQELPPDKPWQKPPQGWLKLRWLFSSGGWLCWFWMYSTG